MAATAIQPPTARVYRIMSEFFSGSLNPFWPHVVLLAFAIAASFAVAVGIVMENPKWSLANALVVGGVAIEAACTLLLFGFDEGISSRQSETISTQQVELLALGIKTGAAKQLADSATEKAGSAEKLADNA